MRARCTLPIKTPALRKRGPPARLPSPRLDHSRIGSASGAGFFTTRRINPAFKSRCRGEKSRNFVPTFRPTDRILHPFPRYSHPPIIPHFAFRLATQFLCAREEEVGLLKSLSLISCPLQHPLVKLSSISFFAGALRRRRVPDATPPT